MGKINKKNRIYLFVLLAVYCLGLMTVPIYGQEKEQQVLLLNSYHPTFTWTSEITGAVQSELWDSGLNVRTYIEYMDWKNFPTKQNVENLYITYKEKYKHNKFDLIITTDDKALEFALEHRKKLFSNVPIIFCGINEEGEQDLIKGDRNLTGVIEKIDLEDTISMALKINPKIKELYVIHDQTESGKSTYKIIKDIINSSHDDIRPISISNKTHRGIIESIKGLHLDSAILITTYFQDVLGKPLEFERLCELVSQASAVPVFHMYAMTMGHGNIGGAMLSGEEQGMVAGQMAVRVLKGEQADEIPIFRETPLKLIFDYDQLKRFNIPTDVIPEEATMINQPFSFCKAYKELVMGSLSVLIILVVFIIVLFFHIKRVKKVKNELQTRNKEIHDAYEELAASDEELQQQLDEITSIQNQLREMAYYDPLTQMPNKRALEEDFESYIRDCKGQKGAVIFIDADNFKLVNDTLGHTMGDKFIIKIGERLQEFEKDTLKVYRMGGDEFLVLIKQVKDESDIKRKANKIVKGFRGGFLIEGMLIHTTVSAGIAIYPDHGETSETLIMRSDIAMYKAKEKGKDKYVFYNNEMNNEMIERANIEKNLKTAIEDEEFSLNYQPQYDFKTKKITGFEALLRWNNKELGPVPPSKFIKVAEDSHTIISIGRWVLETACKFAKSLHQLGYTDYTMAVNISSLQAMQEDFVEMVLEILKEADLEPKQLEIEMTESMLIQNFKVVVRKLDQLRKHGIKVALDDFGTGYSSLNYLNLLPIDTLKIDKSFVDMICVGEEEQTIINILISLGHGMGIKVVAEGVETEDEFDYLRKYGCDSMQGYLLSKPVTEDKVIELLRRE